MAGLLPDAGAGGGCAQSGVPVLQSWAYWRGQATPYPEGHSALRMPKAPVTHVGFGVTCAVSTEGRILSSPKNEKSRASSDGGFCGGTCAMALHADSQLLQYVGPAELPLAARHWHCPPVSTRHLLEQQSPSTVLPSSHSSRGSLPGSI